jgi:cytochrome c biogenesis protein CcdA
MELGLLGALAGGVLTLLSPCSVMLLPAFFSYAFSSPAKLLARTGVFYLGLITTLVPLGVLAGTVGAFVTAHRLTLVAVLSAVVIALGVLMVLDVPLPSPPSRRRTGGADAGAPGAPGAGGAADGTSALAVYVLGTVYGLAGVCAGPLLGAVLTVAAVSASALYGGLVLLVFAAGMAFPLVLLAALWRRLPAIQRLVRPRVVHLGPVTTTVTGIVGGLFTCALGVLLLVTGGTSSLGGLLGASKQVELEGAVRLATQAVPDWAVLVAVAAVAGIAWGVSRVRAGTP